MLCVWLYVVICCFALGFGSGCYCGIWCIWLMLAGVTIAYLLWMFWFCFDGLLVGLRLSCVTVVGLVCGLGFAVLFWRVVYADLINSVG